MAVRGVGEKAVEAVIAERKKTGAFTSLYDFCERVDQRQVTRSTVEAFVRCGAFSSLKAKRSQLVAILERAVEMGQQSQQDKRMGQLNMFGGGENKTASRPVDVLPDIPEFAGAELLKFEKELLGFYITNHPLTEHEAALLNYSTANTREIKAMPEGTEVTIGGLINRVKRAVTKTGRSAGQPMCIITLEDLDGQIEATIFAESLEKINEAQPGIVALEQIVFVKGKVDRRRETPGIIVNELIPISQAMARFTRGVKVEIDRIDGAIETLRELKGILSKHQGNCQTYLSVPATGEKRALIALDKQWWIRATPALKEELEFALNGHGRVELAGDGTRRTKAQQQPLFPGSEVAEIPDETPAMSLPVEELEY